MGDEIGLFLQEGVQRQVGWSVYVRDDERAYRRFDGDELDLERGHRAGIERHRADVNVAPVDEGQAASPDLPIIDSND